MVHSSTVQNLGMKAYKFDPALAGELQKQQDSASRFDVTVRVAAPLPASQVSELSALGVQAEARRSILVADLDLKGLSALSDIDGVVRISLAQTLRPSGPRSR